MSNIISNFGQNVAQMNPLSIIGQGISQVNQNRQANEQALLQQQALTQATKEQAIRDQQLRDAYTFLQSGDATAQDYANLAMMLPKEKAEALTNSFNLLTEDEQRNTLNETGKVFSSFKAGRPDVATDLLDKLATTFENSGEPEDAQLMRKWSEIVKSSPEGAAQAENYFGFIMSQIPGGTDVIDSAINLSKESRTEALQPGVLQKQAADLGLTIANTNKIIADTKELTQKTAQAVIELEGLKNSGGLDAKELSDKENTLRKEYNGLIGDFEEITSTFDNITASANEGTGAGDVALVTGFMKMLDPGSVVRETEFATARNTAGTYGMLQTILPKVKEGILLTPTQRKNFKGLAEKYLGSYKKKADSYRKQYVGLGDKYGIDAESIVRPLDGLDDAKNNTQVKIYGGL